VTIVRQSQVSDCDVCSVHNSYKSGIAWNLLILRIDPVVDRFSIHCVARVYALDVFRGTGAIYTEVVHVSGHRVTSERVVARIIQVDAVVVVRARGVVRKRVVARRATPQT